MSDFWNAISLGGFLLTAIGTIVSCKQAYIAKKAAKDAQKYRDEILVDRLKLVLIDLLSTARHSRVECKKIITPVGKPIRGVDVRKVIDTLQDFLDKCNENAHKLNMDLFTNLLEEFDESISLYKKENDIGRKYEIADNMYTTLSHITSIIAEKIDEKI